MIDLDQIEASVRRLRECEAVLYRFRDAPAVIRERDQAARWRIEILATEIAPHLDELVKLARKGQQA